MSKQKNTDKEYRIQALINDLKYNIMGIREKAVKKLDELGWAPRNDREKVLYFLAKKQWDELLKLGELGIKKYIKDSMIGNLQFSLWGFEKYNKDMLRVLVKAGTPAVKLLIKVLKDKDFQIREWTAWALGYIGDERAVEPLIKALKDEYWYVRRGAAWGLGMIGDARAVEPLIEALKEKYSFSGQQDIRRGATWSLGEIGDARAVEPLIEALKDEYWEIQGVAAEALGKTGELAVEQLIQALKDEDWLVRKGTAVVLGEIGDPRSVEHLIKVLKDEDWRVREKAAEALGKIGEKKAKESLIQTLKDKNYYVQEEAIKALTKIKDKKPIDPSIMERMKDLKSGDWYVRWEATEELDKLGWEPRDDREKALYLIAKGQWNELVKLGEVGLIELIKDLKNGFIEWRWDIIEGEEKQFIEDYDFVEKVFKFFIGIGEVAVGTLIRALEDEDWYLRMKVAEILGRIGDKRAIQPLAQTLKYYIHNYDKISLFEIELVDEGEKKAFWAAAEALAKLGAKKELEPLFQVLVNDLKNEDAWEIREKAAEELDILGWEPRNERENVLYLIAKGQWDELVKLGKLAIKELIQDLKCKDKFLGEAALEILVKIGEPTVNPLIKALKDEDEHVQEGAYYALGYIGEKSLEPLIQALKEENWEVRAGAAYILGFIGDKSVIKALRKALNDEHLSVQQAAKKALEKITTEKN